jgi:hypothetical protein
MAIVCNVGPVAWVSTNHKGDSKVMESDLCLGSFQQFIASTLYLGRL